MYLHKNSIINSANIKLYVVWALQERWKNKKSTLCSTYKKSVCKESHRILIILSVGEYFRFPLSRSTIVFLRPLLYFTARIYSMALLYFYATMRLPVIIQFIIVADMLYYVYIVIINVLFMYLIFLSNTKFNSLYRYLHRRTRNYVCSVWNIQYLGTSDGGINICIMTCGYKVMNKKLHRKNKALLST